MEILTDEIIIEKLEQDGIMMEPDANWLIEYINSEYGGTLDNTTDWCDQNYMLKIYSESTYDGYDIWWCTHDERPYVSQDGFYYEDHNEWSSRAIDELTSGGNVWVEQAQSTSSTVYKVQVRHENGGADVYVNRTSSGTDDASCGRYSSSIIVMEFEV